MHSCPTAAEDASLRRRSGTVGWTSRAARSAETRGHHMRRSRLARIFNSGIGRIETAASLDGPSYVVETAIARPAQIAGRPAERIGDVLHGTRYGHPVHPMLVTIPIGTWTFALGLDLLAALGVLRAGDEVRAA